ncbi:MAG: TIM barrel protein [Caldilineaceae bacterium]|nr:TIM barrel protein [Caldilineaceae bacterium]
MLKSGLVSVTFRKLSTSEVIDLVAEAGLEAIEWGGDVHVPAGDLADATRVGDATRAAGLAVAAYGSYYRAGHPESGPFEAVLESAAALGAPMIRVWAGRQGLAASDGAYWAQVVADLRRIGQMGQGADIKVVLEFHRNTLTETNRSAPAARRTNAPTARRRRATSPRRSRLLRRRSALLAQR